MKKRVLSLFMALALCFSMLPTAALAEEAGAAPDAANADSTYTTGEDAGLAGGEDDSAPDDTDGGDTDSSGKMQDGEADTAVSAVQETPHANHCVCGGNGDVNGHNHDTAGKEWTEWTTTDSLPNSAGSYYLTKSVSGDWTVPTDGEVNLCLNGQTINGKITIGSGAKLTLTDCSSDNSGKIQGGVTVNGGTLELYGGTIIGGVEVGRHSNPATGSAFTMYGGTISGNTDTGGVFLVGTTNDTDPPRFTMHGGTISGNTAAASDGGGGGVYVGEKCSFTMDGGTITGNTATAGNGGGIYIHFNAGNVSISNATITGNKASATGNTSYGHGGGIYSERGVTVENVTITGNNSTFEGGGIYGNGTINLTDATVTGNNQYDVYYGGKESSAPELTVAGSVKAGYYANYAWKLPILVSGALREDSVIRVGVREGINLGAIAEPASGVTLRAENFKADAADCVTSLGEDGNVYLVPCTHEMDDTGYTCKKCHTQFDARVGDSAYYQTLTKAFDAARGNTVTLLRDVTLTENCSSSYIYSATLDLNGKTVSSERYYIGVGDGNNPRTLTVMNSGTNSGTQPLTVRFLVHSNGTLAVGDSYTGEISRVELQAGGALERFGGEIGELVLSNAAHGSTSTGYGLKLWKGNTNACTIGKFTDNNKSKSLTVKDLLGTDYAKCELYGENSGTWSVVDKSTKIVDLKGYTAYKVQFPECVHQCADDSNPVCSVCHKKLYTKITAKAADGTTKTAYFTEDSALENGYVEAIQTLNGWSNEGCTEPTLTLLRDMYAYGTSMPLTGTLTLKGGTHTAKNVTVAKNADVTFASGSYEGATIDGTATVKEGVTFTDASVEVNGTLNAKGGTFNGPVEFNGSSIANISGGSFTSDRVHGGVQFSNYSGTGTISGGTFVLAWFYTTKVKLSGGTFNEIVSSGDNKLAALLAEGAAYYDQSGNAISNSGDSKLYNVTVKTHAHTVDAQTGICSGCHRQMAASLTVGGTTSWYEAFATAIKAANAADGEKTITLYQNVDDTVYGKRTTYELTRGPVTLATGGKRVDGVDLTAKGISLTVTGSNGGFYVTVDGKDAELTVNDGNTKLAIVTAKNGGKLSLSNGAFSRVAVKDDGSSASLSGGIYGEITSGNDYVKPYALLAKGYAYKKTKDNQWLPNANSIPSEVTVEKAPYAVEKIYPNSDTNYTENSAFATDGKITLTAVIAPETQGVTYTYWWELFNESENDWTTQFSKVNAATHTGGKSKTLTISGLPVDKSYQYHIFVQCSNGYNCYSEPFTVTRHQHSWTYTASSGATITAKCSKCSASGGSVTIAAPAELTYNGKGKPATVAASSDWQGPAASGITISYMKKGSYSPERLENGALPTNAGTYTASITLKGADGQTATASVEYTIAKAEPAAEDFNITTPGNLTYDGTPKTATVTSTKNGMGAVTVKYCQGETEVPPINAGKYIVKISVEEGTNYNAAADLTVGTLVINKINYPGVKTAADTVRSGQETTGKTLTLPILPDGASYAASGTVGGATGLISSHSVSGTTLTYSTTNQTDGTEATITIPVTGATNYNDYSIVVTVTAKDKADAGVSITTPPTSKTYGDADFTLTATKSASAPDDGTWSWTSTDTAILEIVSGANTAMPTIKVKKADTTGATLTVTYESDTHMGSASATITVAQKEVTISGITANNKEYDGNTNATVNASGATITGKVDGDDLTVSVAAGSTFDSADAGSRTVTLGTLTLDGTSAGNYTLATSGNQATATANITVRDLTVKPNSGQRKSYGTTPDPVLAYTSTGTVTGETAAFDGALSREAGEDVGQYDITKGSLELKDSGTFKATNYNLVLDTAEVTFEITKGTYGGSAPTKTVNILKNYAGVQTGTLTAADFFTTVPAEAKITVLPSPGTVTIMSSVAVDASGNLTYRSKPNIAATADENCAVTISSKNYTDIIATLTFKLVDKTDVSAQITFPNGTLTYNGAGQKYEKATTSTTAAGTPVWTYIYAPADATASLDSAGLPKTAGTYTVTAKYEDDTHIGTKPATLTVSKATPTGAPTCTKITTSGKTLADAPLAIGTIAPAGGTLAWDMAATTVVAANTAYGWTYTPADTANYKALTGSLTPYAVSSGGGGGSYTPSYTVSVDKTVNGTITVSPKSASKGDTVTITVKPDKGYELDTLKVLDKNGDKVKLTEKNGKYTFTMPAGKVTVKGSFVEEAPEQIFTDVPVDAYFYEAVKWAAEKGITGGVGNGLFAPNQPCTRAQIVTFLWRAAGSPTPKNMSSFADVPADAFYAKAVAWAVENGITGGTGDGKFSPDATCTRAQAVTFLYRASGAPAVSGNAAFSDVATNAYYAAAVKWAEKNGITGGIGGGLFGSDNNCTRAQIVTFLYRNYQSK